MKTTLQVDYYRSMFNLGIELWFPKHSHWQVFSINLLLGPFQVTIAFGSKKRFDHVTALLSKETV